MKKICAIFVLGIVAGGLLSVYGFGQTGVPTVDGGSGPCSVEFIATDSKGALVSNAQISVHIEYGFLGAHKLDLQVITDSHGKARFVGLPDKVDTALFFEAIKGTLKGVATVDPNTECEAHHGIYMTSKNFTKEPEE